MGFEAPRTVLDLAFEDPALNGLEVKMYVPPLGEARRLTVVARSINASTSAGQDLSQKQEEQALSMYEALAAHMKSWNVTRGGVPVPTDMEGLDTQETTFLNKIFVAWLAASGDVEAPLEPASPSTPLPDLASVLMEPIPESLANW